MSCLVGHDLGHFDPDHVKPNMTRSGSKCSQKLLADDQSSPAGKELRHFRLTIDLCACNHKLSVTSHINCIAAHCLIGVVYIKACAFIRSWWCCTFERQRSRSHWPMNGTRHSTIPRCIHTPNLGFLSQIIWDVLLTQLLLKLGQRSRSQRPENGMWHSAISRCLYTPNLEFLFRII